LIYTFSLRPYEKDEKILMEILKLRLIKLVSWKNFLGESLADHFSCFWDVLSCKIVCVFNIDFIDL